MQKDLTIVSSFSSEFIFFGYTHMLRICLQCVYILFTEHTLANCMRMLSIRQRSAWAHLAYSFEKIHRNRMDHLHRFMVEF